MMAAGQNAREGGAAVGLLGHVARAPIHLLDRILRRATGVFEFTDDPDCIIRTRVGRTPHMLALPERHVLAGEKALEIHLWNEHVRPIPPGGATLSYAVWVRRAFVSSLEQLAHYTQATNDLADLAAVGGVSVLVSPQYAGGMAWMERLGFTILPYHSPLGRFGEFWENVYAWWLMWAFNPASVRHRNALSMRRSEMWMTAEAFLARYGADDEADRERR
jgi:hypothetical protein